MIWMFITSLAIAVTIAPIVIWWYRRYNWLDDPRTNTHAKVLHTKPIPRGGGVVVWAGVVLTSLLFLQLDSYLIGILLSVTILMIMGWLDDIFDLHPLPRLLVGTVVGLITVGTGIGVAYVTNPFGPGVIWLNQPQLVVEWFGQTRTIWIMADLLALSFIVWNINIVNWSKGLDGQLPGIVTISAIIIGVLSQRFQDDPTTFNTLHLSFIVAGSFLGLLVWNWFPQKMMPGYGGGAIAGYLLAVLAILSGAKFATMLMVLALPTADAVFTIARRINAGKLPWWGDRGHLHHKLHDVLGWGKRRVAVFYWLVSLVLGLSALVLNTTGKIVLLGLVTSLVFSFLIWVKLKQ